MSDEGERQRQRNRDRDRHRIGSKSPSTAHAALFSSTQTYVCMYVNIVFT